MRYDVKKLEGALLDAAVAKADRVRASQGHERCWAGGVPMYRPPYEPWIAVMSRDYGAPWRVAVCLPPDYSVMYGTGPTHLIAAKRAFSASKFGETVELP
jgi:hypothetical protein